MISNDLEDLTKCKLLHVCKTCSVHIKSQSLYLLGIYYLILEKLTL